MFSRFIQNHVLANLFFLMVIALGTISYLTLPREQDPTINFNWIQVTTALPGASAIDIEKRITDPLEDVIRSISDIKFVSSNSREGISSILIRFNEISERIFDKRIADLRREIQNKQNELPEDASDPFIFEITTDNAYPTASIVAISSIHLLKKFMNAQTIDNDKLMWFVIIHLTFVVSAIGMAYVDKLNKH